MHPQLRERVSPTHHPSTPPGQPHRSERVSRLLWRRWRRGQGSARSGDHDVFRDPCSGRCHPTDTLKIERQCEAVRGSAMLRAKIRGPQSGLRSEKSE